MAAGTKIIFEFAGASGDTIKHSYNYGNASAPASDVKAYMQGCITNKNMFNNPPYEIKKAYAETTSVTEFDLSD